MGSETERTLLRVASVCIREMDVVIPDDDTLTVLGDRMNERLQLEGCPVRVRIAYAGTGRIVQAMYSMAGDNNYRAMNFDLGDLL